MSGKYALIIGNAEYKDPGLARLTAPGKDAEDFARVLQDQNICSFDQVNILLNQLSSTVIEAIDEFFVQKKPDDLLILYFSGHGVRDEFGSLYLAVRNTIRSRLRSTAIRTDYIREAMDQSRSKRQVLILDCCNSGAFAQGTKAATGGSFGTASAFEGTGYGRVVLTASDSTQFAWEGDKVIGETDNSLFTHFLVKGLEGEADKNHDGKITVDDLYDYTYEQIVIRTPKQTPGKWSYKQQGEIALRELTEAQQEQIRAVEQEKKNRLAKEEAARQERVKAEWEASERAIAQLKAEREATEREVARLRAERESEEELIASTSARRIEHEKIEKLLTVFNSQERNLPLWLKAILMPTHKNYERLLEKPRGALWLALWWVLLSGSIGITLGIIEYERSLSFIFSPDSWVILVLGLFFGICSTIVLASESTFTHLVSRIIGGRDGFKKLMYLLALINTPSPLAILYLILELLIGFSWGLSEILLAGSSILFIAYSTFLGILATKTVYKFKWWQAILAGLSVRLIIALLIGWLVLTISTWTSSTLTF